MKILGVALVLLAVSMVPQKACAQFPIDEVIVGVLAQGMGPFGSDKEQGAGINGEVLFTSPAFLEAIGSPRPQLGLSYATDPDATSQFYFGIEWRTHVAERIFVAASFGGAIHNGETKFDPFADAGRVENTTFLGCRVLFRFGGDIGYELTDRMRASVHFDHISNAGLCQVNEGLDNFGVRLGFSL
jgi:lipid A 3-O-deacylase